MNNTLDQKIKIITLATGIILFVVSTILYLLFSLPRGHFPIGQIITIPHGSNSNEISKILKEKRAIKSVLFFDLLTGLLSAEKKIKAGDYIFDSPLSSFQIVRKVVAGDYNIQNEKFLIKEGSTIKDIGLLFENKGFFQAEELWEIAGFSGVDYRKTKEMIPPPDDLYSVSSLLESKPKYVGFEGYLFPDTYFFPQNISPRGVMEIMVKNLDRKITDEIREGVAGSKRSFFEIITMASILEKEAITFEDKKIISGILWKRLNKGMLLQVDATLQYITGRNTYELTENDLNTDSPYNTYEYKGLPLGPIANPGMDSIKAAIYPEDSPYWYYLSDKNHNVYYSETFEEHKAKKAMFL